MTYKLRNINKIVLAVCICFGGFFNSWAGEVEYLEKTCNEKSVEAASACTQLGKKYDVGWGAMYDGVWIVKQDFNKAAELYKKGCKLKDAEGCQKLGVLYVTGKGVKPNDKKAEKLFKKACEEDYALGCYHLGLLYELHANNKMAYKYYKKACMRVRNACASSYRVKNK